MLCECSCDCEGPILYNKKYHVAIKPHTCCECGSTIDPGERYERVDGLWDFGFATYKTCAFCQSIRSKAEREADTDACIALGELWNCVLADEIVEE